MAHHFLLIFIFLLREISSLFFCVRYTNRLASGKDDGTHGPTNADGRETNDLNVVVD